MNILILQVSVFLQFIWLIWLSLQYYNHDIFIADIQRRSRERAEINNNNITNVKNNAFDSKTMLSSSFSSSTINVNFHDLKEVKEKKEKKKYHDSSAVNSTKKKKKKNFTDHSIEHRINNRKTLEIITYNNNHTQSFKNYSTGEVRTECFLLTSYTFNNNTMFIQSLGDNSDKDVNDTSTSLSFLPTKRSFVLNLEFMTDQFPEHSSWTLRNHHHHHHRKRLIIDSTTDNSIKLSQNTSYNFEYSCNANIISIIPSQHKEKVENITAHDNYEVCYDFEMYDKLQYSLRLKNNNTNIYYFNNTSNNNNNNVNNTISQHTANNNALMSSNGRFYSHSETTTFCLDLSSDMDNNTNNDNDHHHSFPPIQADITNGTSKNISHSQKQRLKMYPSRDCLNDYCVCDSKPSNLLSNNNHHNNDITEEAYPYLHQLKSQVMTNILILSGTESLNDVESPQYEAACWILNDDPYLITSFSSTLSTTNSSSGDTSHHYYNNNLYNYSEKRMMQRYILALIYFSTKPQNWSMHLNFLSIKSECDWYEKKDEEDGTRVGAACNEKDDVISLTFYQNNLDGTIVEEITSLESLGKCYISALFLNNIIMMTKCTTGKLIFLFEINYRASCICQRNLTLWRFSIIYGKNFEYQILNDTKYTA